MKRSDLTAIARAALSGQRDATTCESLGITPSELQRVRKSDSYKTLASALAGQMLEEAGAELQALAKEAVGFLRSTLAVPKRNARGTKRLADPQLIKEQRLTATAIIDLAIKCRESVRIDREEDRLEPVLASLLAVPEPSFSNDYAGLADFGESGG